MNRNELMLFNVKVMYASLDPDDENTKKYGPSISILTGECGEQNPELHEALNKYYAKYRIGKEGDEDVGVPRYKETEDGAEEYLTLKITNHTKFIGLGKKALDEDSNVDLILTWYPYENEYGKGNGVSVAMVNVNSTGKNAIREDELFRQKKIYEKQQRMRGREAEAEAASTAEAASGAGAKPDTTPPLEGGDAEAASRQAGAAKAQGVSEPTTNDDIIDLEDIPF